MAVSLDVAKCTHTLLLLEPLLRAPPEVQEGPGDAGEADNGYEVVRLAERRRLKAPAGPERP